MNKQAGFSRTQVIVAVVVVFLVVFIGWFVVRSKNASNDNQTTSVSTDQYQNAAPGKAAQANVSNDSSTPGSKIATDFYKAYLNATGSKTNIVSKYGTANLVAYYQSYNGTVDGISCSVKTPLSLSVSSLGADSTSESLTVSSFSESAGTLQITVKTVLQGDSWKVDSVTCPS